MLDTGGEDRGQKRALIMSISEYDRLAPLDFCEKDGIKVYEVLSRLGYTVRDEYKLIGGRIEYWRVRKAIIDFFYDRSINPNDTILFYFSGHGVLGDDGEHYLSTSEIDPDMPQGLGFSFDDLTKARGNCNSKTIFTILDCCYSGADKLGKGGELGIKAQEESAGIAKNIIRNKSILPGEGKCILSACKPMQKAYEFEEHGHSFFTYYLTEALSNKECVDEEGDVTPELLGRYIDYKIRNLPEKIRPKQTPFLNCQLTGKIIIAHYPRITKQRDGYLLNLLRDGKIEEFNRKRAEEDIPLVLRGLDFSGKDLRGADLHEVDLSGTRLVKTKLDIANLKGAKLKLADLSQANLKSADLYGANLSGANLTGANLRGADLKGMIDFSEANLTGANLRGADLSGMVNFAGAILHDIDFSGCITERGLINTEGAQIRNVRGLPINLEDFSVLHQPNQYLQSLKLFSKEIKQQFKIHNIPADKLEPIEDGLKELTEEVRDIHERPEVISSLKKRDIDTKFTNVTREVIRILSLKSDSLTIFSVLSPFSHLIGTDIQQKAESVQKEFDRSKGLVSEEIQFPRNDPVIKQPMPPSSSSDLSSTPPLTLNPGILLHKNVKCSDRRDIGYIAGASGDTITILGGGSQVYRIPRSFLVSFYGGDVMINLSFKEWKEIRHKYLL
jgi:uncharacterized protein YjbI with pentapeptide repeats